MKENVVINDVTSADNITLDSGNILAEEQRDKIIQSIPKSPENAKDFDALPEVESQSKQEEEEAEDKPQPSNSIPFPPTHAQTAKVVPEITNETQTQAYGRGQHPRKNPGEYRTMNEGLVTMVANNVELQSKDMSSDCSENEEAEHFLPPDSAFVSNLCTEPKTLDEALRVSDAKEWQMALDYEIGQLEKLGTWVVEDLPKGQSAIPCNEVLKIKRGPDGEIKSYRVRIVTGGNRQVEGVNYTETFSSVEKMPTVCIVLENAAEQD